MEDKKRKCWECRRRRLVCDLARPGCTRCQSAGRSCPGYRLDKPLKWMQPPQEIRSRHAPRRQLEFASSSGNTDSQEPNPDSHAPGTTSTTEGAVLPLVRQPQDDPPHDICQGSTEQAIFIFDPCALKIQQELAEIFESVEYWNSIVCPDLVATGKGGQANPFFLPTCIVSRLPRSAVLTLVSAAIGHRLLRSHALPASASDRSALTTKLHHHRMESIRALTADLAEQDKQLSDATLAAVLALLLAEIQQTSSPSWQHHLRGASTIINLRGGFGHLILTNTRFRFIYRYYAIIDIIRITTTPHPPSPPPTPTSNSSTSSPSSTATACQPTSPAPPPSSSSSSASTTCAPSLMPPPTTDTPAPSPSSTRSNLAARPSPPGPSPPPSSRGRAPTISAHGTLWRGYSNAP
ncbi:fungal-specific transcription factor domain-containing protein [Schizothecium vesticola]|uniref:Fungal-specific transcription factor domain-containing protein n=1 Tax=Schizothecium vesticola TaxID=314040 RepID=A0AA40EWR8_9PEZI|nr:fungal-specific transcription factor domain-containing protein [Schizothecium vesticola]